MLNLVTLEGRIVREPSLAKTKSGSPVLAFSLAHPKTKDEAEYYDIVAWSAVAEYWADKLWKGRIVTIVGSLRMRDYEDRDGNKKRKFEISAAQIHSTDWRQKAEFTPVEDEGGLPF